MTPEQALLAFAIVFIVALCVAAAISILGGA